MNKGNNKKQFLIFGLCSFLALVLCMVTLVVIVKKVDEGQAQGGENQLYVSKTHLNSDVITLKEYIRELTEATQGNKFIKVDSYRDVYIDDGSVLIDGENDSADKKLFIFMKDCLMSTVDSLYGDDYTGVFGSVNEKMPSIDLVSVSDVVCSYSVGQTDENGEQIFDDDGNLVDEEYYFLTFEIDSASIADECVKKSVGLNDVPDIQEGIKDAISEDCKAEFTSVEPESFIINAKINRLTDEISQIEIKRVYKVTADLQFVNKLSVFGEKIAEFQYTVQERYEYSYAGVTFLQNSFEAEAGEEISLNVNAVIEDDSEYEVKFISSDEKIAAVDEMGYVQVLKTEPVTITVQLKYLSEIFTDECIINGTDSLSY